LVGFLASRLLSQPIADGCYHPTGGAGLKYVRLQGGMSNKQRQQAIQEFRRSPEVVVFLLSLRAGGVGLNLTEVGNFSEVSHFGSEQLTTFLSIIGKPHLYARLLVQSRYRRAGIRQVRLYKPLETAAHSQQ